ncbi:class I SAM-dependent methyltransferase [Rhodococcus sp. G-MC3]|uniref:class I SAM-dependent methyltransferase n=1 Tax=Rhodococcus sp. G-MC3 TaxID=3046209 RepID=UPI0024B9051B|nr:class I SAM-dependent methyltransferase [Rhodococcus sp. G-MC3]MDJ0396003.1 class I SAM-dependent methyltransferase [Rhodococcus sp. G-MC3]
MSDSRLASTFNSTSEYFDFVTPLVWGPAGQSLAFALELAAGESVLDVCAGTGASALPAAAAVGPYGVVHAIDLADDLLEVGRLKATESALRNVEFVCADATEWESPSSVSGGYDALSCSYGIFFLPDMEVSFSRLVGLVRPGGRVGVTVWRKGAVEAFGGAFFDVVERHAPGDAHTGLLSRKNYDSNPIRRVETEETLRAWLADQGLKNIQVRVLSNQVPATEDFIWNFVLGSGFRGALQSFDDNTCAEIRREFSELLTSRGIDSVDATTLVATGVRPS